MRARATLRFEPRRLPTSIPRRLSFESRVIYDGTTLATLESAVRPRDHSSDVLFSRLVVLGLRPNSAPAAFDFVMRLREYSLVQFLVFRLQIVRAEHRREQMSLNVAWPKAKLRSLTSNPLRVSGPTFRPKSRRSSHAQFHVDYSQEKLLARSQQRPYPLAIHRFGVYRTEPTHPDQVSKPTSNL